MKASKKSSAPVCRICGRSGDGVTFAIFNPRFPPFGTACTDCEEAAAPGASLESLLRAPPTAAQDKGGHDDVVERALTLARMEAITLMPRLQPMYAKNQQTVADACKEALIAHAAIVAKNTRLVAALRNGERFATDAIEHWPSGRGGHGFGQLQEALDQMRAALAATAERSGA